MSPATAEQLKEWRQLHDPFSYTLRGWRLTAVQRKAANRRREVILDHVCVYCYWPYELTHVQKRRTSDHVWPRSRYAAQSPNTVPCCMRCNTKKGNRKPTGCELIALFWCSASFSRFIPPAKVLTREERPRYVRLTSQITTPEGNT